MREKELLYSMLGDIMKERNELMKFIMNRIENLDGDNPIKELDNVVVNDNIEKIQTEEITDPEYDSSVEIKDKSLDNFIDVVDVEIEEDEEDIAEEIEDSTQEDSIEDVVDIIEENGNKEELPNVDNNEIIAEKPTEVNLEIEESDSLIDAINKRNAILGMEDVTKKKSLIPKDEIERAKDKDRNNNNSTLNIDRVKGIIVSILKERKKPMHVQDIHANLNFVLSDNGEGEVKITNLRNNILPRIAKSNKNVIKSARGYYKYNH